MEEIHLFIIWQNALNKKDDILEDIGKNFEIVKEYMIVWSSDKFAENLSRFYGTNLPKNSGKEQHCGNGPFMLIIVKDKNPIYEARTTSRGEEIVNINMFDKKAYYRELTGGGHKIHATNNQVETNHDLTLLLHISVEDFMKQENLTQTKEIEEVKQDLFGANGWKDAKQMFYALNHCIDYALLRNYENLPEDIYVNEHNDIDLICNSKENCAYILNAEKVFPEDFRVHYVTNVGNKKAYFDLRYVGDNYYCQELEEELLKTRIYNEKGFYTINNELYFYTLLYHALLHKKEFAEDYKTRLINMNIEQVNEETIEKWKDILAKWLAKTGYHIETPEDISVMFNPENVQEINNKILVAPIKNNIIDWYPYEENIKYFTLEDFSKDKVQELEKIVKELPENSKVLIMADNRLSIKNICQNIENQDKLFNRKEIEELLDKNGLVYRKFYYPLPDAEMTNVIFTDSHLPDKETIKRNIEFYRNNEIIKNNENELYQNIIAQDENLFKTVANTFLIECSKDNFEDNNIEFVAYSNMRKEEYRVRTVIKCDNVYKNAADEKAINHIEQVKNNIDIMKKIKLDTLDSYEGDTIISKYQKGKEDFDKIIENKLYNNEVEQAITLINDLFEELKEKLQVVKPEKNVFDKYEISYKVEDIQNLTFVKYGLWDLIFQNMFYIDDKYFFYDQEWFEENLPLEFIIYRSFIYNRELKELENKIYEKFNINEKNIELFGMLDNKLQLKTRNELSWKLHTNCTNITQKIQNLELDKQMITSDCVKLLNEKDARIKFLEDNMEQTCDLLRKKEQEIDALRNSTSWKVTKIFRDLRR